MNINAKCEICKKIAISSKHKYCSDCNKLIIKANRRGIGRKIAFRALKSAQRKGKEGFYCHYTGIRLALKKKDAGKPWYISFDHRVPRKKDDIVVSACLINDMKTDMDEEEFERLVEELCKHFKNKRYIFKPKVLMLKYYKRNYY